MLNIPLKLTKKELQNYEQGLQELEYKNEVEMLAKLEREYEHALEISEKKGQDQELESIERRLFLFIEIREMLYFYYHKALLENNPKILLDALFTTNHIYSTYTFSSGYDHCDKLKRVLLCYAGNNYDLVDDYWPNGIGESNNGTRFLITATNLLLAIRGELSKEDINVRTEVFLTRKNARYEVAIVNTLRSILNQDYTAISEHLNTVTKVFKSIKWLHDMDNPIGKYLPFFSYALLSIVDRHLGHEAIKQISMPNVNTWWQSYATLNTENEFREGCCVYEFEGRLSCIGRIKRV